MPPLFTIITPSFNPGDKLADSFDSVMAQGRGLCDYWVIDGASSAGTREWLAIRNKPRFHWISERDSGVYDAMNKGINISHGQFLLFLGAGDRLLPGALRNVADFIQKSPSGRSRLVYGDVRDIRKRS